MTIDQHITIYISLYRKIKKNEFKKTKNNELEPEPFVTCSDCGRKLHQVCVLHMDSIWPNGYTCDNCHKNHNTKRKENRYTAKSKYISVKPKYVMRK